MTKSLSLTKVSIHIYVSADVDLLSHWAQFTAQRTPEFLKDEAMNKTCAE